MTEPLLLEHPVLAVLFCKIFFSHLKGFHIALGGISDKGCFGTLNPVICKLEGKKMEQQQQKDKLVPSTPDPICHTYSFSEILQ